MGESARARGSGGRCWNWTATAALPSPGNQSNPSPRVPPAPLDPDSRHPEPVWWLQFPPPAFGHSGRNDGGWSLGGFKVGGEFWEPKSTHLKATQVEKPCSGGCPAKLSNHSPAYPGQAPPLHAREGIAGGAEPGSSNSSWGKWGFSPCERTTVPSVFLPFCHFSCPLKAAVVPAKSVHLGVASLSFLPVSSPGELLAWSGSHLG